MSNHHTLLALTRRSSPMHLVSMALLLISLVACSGLTTNDQTPKQTPTAVQQANSFTAFKLGLPAAAYSAPVKGPLPDSTPLHVGVTFKANQAVLDKLKNSNKSTNLEDTAKDLGISDALYQKVKSMFGVTDAKLKLDSLHTYLTVDAPAKTFAQILHISFVQHTYNGRTFFAPTSDPKIPNFLYPSILAITGLDNFTPPPQLHMTTSPLPATTRMPNVCDPAQSVQGIGQAYGYDQLWNQGWKGQGMTVNLVELGPINRQELNYFGNCVQYQGQIKTVDVDGGPDPDNLADKEIEMEAMLDVEMVQALAPAANIVDYQGTRANFDTNDDLWTGINDVLRQIFADNEKNPHYGDVVSISYGASELTTTGSLRTAIDESIKLLTEAEHMTVFVASGDCGAFGGRKWGSLDVDYPAASPFAVAVGGTQVVKDASGKYIEVAWSDGKDKTQCTNQWGTGGGNSSIYPRPNWQKGPGVDNSYAKNQRQLPDIAAIASQVPMYYQGLWQGVNGTSIAAPIWAAGFALVNQGMLTLGLHFFGPDTFYVAATDKDDHPFNDITQGNNDYFPATTGWDYTTGLGTPNLLGLYKALLLTIPQRLGL